jgi:hypothetical protein
MGLKRRTWGRVFLPMSAAIHRYVWQDIPIDYDPDPPCPGNAPAWIGRRPIGMRKRLAEYRVHFTIG